ncbi:uncharacterized protein LOC143645654 [Tamandua tetradactyla]|uniref:uncharacterized protein LOC143645654 n=1 Tax=Tamandua tetradactyla TaxID=48850 RepID=UPI00405411FE
MGMWFSSGNLSPWAAQSAAEVSVTRYGHEWGRLLHSLACSKGLSLLMRPAAAQVPPFPPRPMPVAHPVRKPSRVSGLDTTSKQGAGDYGPEPAPRPEAGAGNPPSVIGTTRVPGDPGKEKGDGARPSAETGPLLTARSAGAPGRARCEGSQGGGKTRKDRNRKEDQVPVPASRSAFLKTPKPPLPPPRALWPRLRPRSHFRHRRRPERKYLSRDARRRGCVGGTPPQLCVTFRATSGLGLDHVVETCRPPNGTLHLWCSYKEQDGAMMDPQTDSSTTRILSLPGRQRANTASRLTTLLLSTWDMTTRGVDLPGSVGQKSQNELRFSIKGLRKTLE